MITITHFKARKDGRETTLVFLRGWDNEIKKLNMESLRMLIFNQLYKHDQDDKNRTYEILAVREQEKTFLCQVQFKTVFATPQPFLLTVYKDPAMYPKKPKVTECRLVLFPPKQKTSRPLSVIKEEEDLIFQMEI